MERPEGTVKLRQYQFKPGVIHLVCDECKYGFEIKSYEGYPKYCPSCQKLVNDVIG